MRTLALAIFLVAGVARGETPSPPPKSEKPPTPKRSKKPKPVQADGDGEYETEGVKGGVIGGVVGGVVHGPPPETKAPQPLSANVMPPYPVGVRATGRAALVVVSVAVDDRGDVSDV